MWQRTLVDEAVASTNAWDRYLVEICPSLVLRPGSCGAFASRLPHPTKSPRTQEPHALGPVGLVGRYFIGPLPFGLRGVWSLYAT